MAQKLNITKSYQALVWLLAIYAFLPFFINFPYIFVTILLIFLSYIYKKAYIYHNFISKAFTFDKCIVLTYLFWQLLVVIRGVFFNFDSFQTFINIIFLNQFSLFAFLLPFIVFWNPLHFNYKFLMKLLHILGVCSVLLVLFNFKSLFIVDYSTLSSDELISYGTLVNIQSPIIEIISTTAFAMFIPLFQSKKWWLFHFCIGFVALLISLYAARRGASAIWLLLIINALFLKIKSKRGLHLHYYLAIIIFFLSLFFYVYNNLDTTFSLLGERGGTDSRSLVESYFWNDLTSSLDLIVGRGLNGSYYCPMSENGNWLYYRTSIETGYCHIILTGGLISLILYVIIMLRSAYLGFFRSNNMFAKAFSIYILSYLFYLIPFGIPAFSMTYLICWLGVSMCHSLEFRKLSNYEVKQIYF